jgi:hypothetical protein
MLLKKGAFRKWVASDKAYQLLAHGRWFYPGTPASSIYKTGPRIFSKRRIFYLSVIETDTVTSGPF